jgi:hypothetical protein
LDQAAKEQNIHRFMVTVEVNHQDLQASKLTVAALAEHIQVMVQLMHTVFHHHGVQVQPLLRVVQAVVQHIHIQAVMDMVFLVKDFQVVILRAVLHMRVVVAAVQEQQEVVAEDLLAELAELE